MISIAIICLCRAVLCLNQNHCHLQIYFLPIFIVTCIQDG